jgi:hypothetical protein
MKKLIIEQESIVQIMHLVNTRTLGLLDDNEEDYENLLFTSEEFPDVFITFNTIDVSKHIHKFVTTYTGETKLEIENAELDVFSYIVFRKADKTLLTMSLLEFITINTGIIGETPVEDFINKKVWNLYLYGN